MNRLIIQNDDKIPDEILALIIIKGLPEKGTALFNTHIGEIVVSVVNGRKSRVYTFIQRENPNLLINIFGNDEVPEEQMKAFSE